MKLEPGKYYRRRDGQVTGPMSEIQNINPSNPCVYANNHTYRVNGGKSQCCSDKLDIICEVHVVDNPIVDRADPRMETVI